MALLPATVTLIGKGTTNPALPTHDLHGTLSIKNGNLVFSSGKFVHKIPLEHADNIQRLDIFESWGQEWRALLTLFLSGAIILGTAGLGFIPLIWLLWWYYSPTEVQILVKAWDEEHGLNATTVFSLGKQRKYRDLVKEMIQEIWKIRGEYRKKNEQRGQLVYRQ